MSNPGSFEAAYFDGRTSARRTVTVTVAGDTAVIRGDGAELELRLSELNVQPRVGRLPVRIELPGGGLLVADHDAVAGTLAIPPARGAAHRLESHLGVVLASLAGIVVAAVLAYLYGIPWLAREVAQRLPPEIEAQIATEGMKGLDNLVFRPSKTMPERKAAVEAIFAGVAAHAGSPAREARLLFRDGNYIGANAFALPGGVVVVTDQLLAALTDDQVAAVLGHELGHLEHRHGTRHILQDALLGLLSLALFGDASAVAGIAATMPTIVLYTRYSRDFEREADRYAYELLRRTQRSPRLMGEALQALEQAAAAKGQSCRAEPDEPRKTPGDRKEDTGRTPKDPDRDTGSSNYSYISTHPATAERIRSAEAAAAEGKP